MTTWRAVRRARRRRCRSCGARRPHVNGRSATHGTSGNPEMAGVVRLRCFDMRVWPIARLVDRGERVSSSLREARAPVARAGRTNTALASATSPWVTSRSPRCSAPDALPRSSARRNAGTDPASHIGVPRMYPRESAPLALPPLSARWKAAVAPSGRPAPRDPSARVAPVRARTLLARPVRPAPSAAARRSCSPGRIQGDPGGKPDALPTDQGIGGWARLQASAREASFDGS
jgi:hypothetical protein